MEHHLAGWIEFPLVGLREFLTLSTIIEEYLWTRWNKWWSVKWHTQSKFRWDYCLLTTKALPQEKLDYGWNSLVGIITGFVNGMVDGITDCSSSADWYNRTMKLRAGLNSWLAGPWWNHWRHTQSHFHLLNTWGGSCAWRDVGNLNISINFWFESLFDHDLTACHSTVTWLVKWSIVMPDLIASRRQWEGIMESQPATMM